MMRQLVRHYLDALAAFEREERDLLSLPINHSSTERAAIQAWHEARVEMAAYRVRDAFLAIQEEPHHESP